MFECKREEITSWESNTINLSGMLKDGHIKIYVQ